MIWKMVRCLLATPQQSEFETDLSIAGGYQEEEGDNSEDEEEEETKKPTKKPTKKRKPPAPTKKSAKSMSSLHHVHHPHAWHCSVTLDANSLAERTGPVELEFEHEHVTPANTTRAR